MRRSWLPLLAVFGLACAHARPETSATTHRTNLVAVGEPLTIDATWAARCIDVLETVTEGLTAKNGRPDVQGLCDEQPFELRLECSSDCAFPDGASSSSPGVGVLHVAPLVPGPLTVTAVSTHAQSGEVHQVQFHYQVVLPTALEVVPAQCLSNECRDAPLPAENPKFWVRLWLDEPGAYDSPVRREAPSIALRVNGRPVPVLNNGVQEMSLAELFPDQRVGAGVAPGVYTLHLQVDSWEVVRQLAVR